MLYNALKEFLQIWYKIHYDSSVHLLESGGKRSEVEVTASLQNTFLAIIQIIHTISTIEFDIQEKLMML